MATSEEIRKWGDLNRAYLAGERIPGIKFRHNSRVAFENEDGIRLEGWIVSVEPIAPDPVYTIERCDGGEDEDVAESKIRLILDPHER